MKRALIDISEDLIYQLDHCAREMEISRAELIRKAIKFWLQENKKTESGAFGLLKKSDKHYDGVKLQRKLRKEW